MSLLVGQGSIIGALLRTWNFLHARQYAVPCVMQNTFSQFHPRMTIILTHAQLVLLSISNGQRAALCLPVGKECAWTMGVGECFLRSCTSRAMFLSKIACQRGWTPAKPAANPAPKAAKPHAKPSAKSAAKPATKVLVKAAAKPTAKPAAGEPILVPRG